MTSLFFIIYFEKSKIIQEEYVQDFKCLLIANEYYIRNILANSV
jgi:hypothetical protein